MLQKYDPRNTDILVSIDGELLPRDQAKVSVFDSVVQGGDAVWEGLRLYQGKIFALEHHLQRLQDSAHALAFAGIPDNADIRREIKKTLEANQMTDGVHIRLTLTRGIKITSGMDPRLNTKGCTLIILAEWKPPVYPENIRLVTASIRRNGPQFLDSKIHHNNLLNNILAKIEANQAGADDAVMLDQHGFVSETNATNIFAIRDEILYTPHADACLPGITRGVVLEIASELDLQIEEKNVSLTELYTADEVFVTGTMGELTSVAEIDGRKIVNKSNTDSLARIKEMYTNLTHYQGDEI